MRVLVTGSQGYIGTVLTPMLLSRGHSVVGLDTDIFAECTYGPPPKEIPVIHKDTRDVTPMELQGHDAVIHLAGLSNDPLGFYRPEITGEINTAASVRIAEMSKSVGVKRFLYASSCSVYGASGDQFLTEESPFNPVTPYGWSKAESEHGMRQLADEHFCITYLRASTAYGMSPRLRFDLVANNLTAWAFTTGNVLLKSDGMPWRPIAHVEDIARAYIAVLEAPVRDVNNEAFNVGLTTENYRIRDLAKLVEDVVPGSKAAFSENASPDKRCYRVDCGKIARQLDYKPQWTAQRGIEQLYQSFVRYGLDVNDFEGPKYKRIMHVNDLVRQGRLGADFRWESHVLQEEVSR